MAEKYRPSNGTEGFVFMDDWCLKCERDRAHQESAGEADGCEIVARTMAFSIDEPGYPVEWIVDASGPKCTAFIQSGAPLPTPRCTKTPDMFANGTVAQTVEHGGSLRVGDSATGAGSIPAGSSNFKAEASRG